LIFHNPLHPAHYVVLKTGFTFGEADHLTSARQVPKLPDYAVIDVPDEPACPGGRGRASSIVIPLAPSPRGLGSSKPGRYGRFRIHSPTVTALAKIFTKRVQG
jgi:hypothetical protein